MKAVSVWQPWAWLLVHGWERPNGKRVENRSWLLPAAMVGKWCLIHAAKTMNSEEFELGRRIADVAGLHDSDLWSRWVSYAPKLDFGGIVGVVKWETDVDIHGVLLQQRVWACGKHHWITADARPLPFVPWRGQQGFFEVPLAELPAEYQWLEKEEMAGKEAKC